MSYTHAQKTRRAPSPAEASKESSAPGPSMDALRSGAAKPTAEQMGHRVDLPDAMRYKMENAFGADLSAVKLYESQTVADAGANAVTQGSDIVFAPGMLDFTSYGGQALLGHELSHVVSQARGEVTGGGFLNDYSLEARADMEGAMAASGRQVYAGPAQAMSTATAAAAAGPMQADKRSKKGAAKAAQGDYSDYAHVKKGDRQGVLNAKKDRLAIDLRNGTDLMGRYGSSTTDILNPVTRQAMSEMSRTVEDPAQKKALTDTMEAMDQQIMVQTMMPASAQQRKNLEEHYSTGGDFRRLQREYAEAPIGKPLLGKEDFSSSEVNAIVKEIDSGDPKVKQQYEAYGKMAAGADIAQAGKSGDALLRMMLLMQMGNFTKTESSTDAAGKKQKNVSQWDKSMANAFSHGARTGFVFGETAKGTDGKSYDTSSVFDAIFAGDKEGAGVDKRSAATHRLLTPSAGKGMKGYKEESGKLAAMAGWRDSGYHNYGMDMAIGGAGNMGIQGEGGKAQVITNDGRSGHMYMGVRDSTDAEHGGTRGGMLVGLETDSPYRMNQTGHMHTAAAVGEENSSTGGMKTDITGDKYGGRTVDFNGATNEDLVAVLNAFTEHINTLRGGDEEQQAMYADLVKQISGKRMSAQEMSTLLGKLNGVKDNEAMLKRLAKARTGGQ